jgi:SAM-dependent methyltransferase
MTDTPRHRAVAALAAARRRAFLPETYAGQESFVSAAEVLELARAAGVESGTRVLDLCCGVGGPGRLVAAATGCRLIGVDRDPGALVLARAGAPWRSRFVAAAMPALPLASTFEVVLLLETVLAFADKAALLAEVGRIVAPGGRLAFTFEEGVPLSAAERAAMPAGDTVWPVELVSMRELLATAGLTIRSLADRSAEHAGLARRLASAYAADGPAIAAALGVPALDALLASHALWVEWLQAGRLRKLAVVCERVAGPAARGDASADREGGRELPPAGVV